MNDSVEPTSGAEHTPAAITSARDLNDLFYFSKVVDEGGFSAAGRALNISKSHLSRRIAALEARLGLRLLQRSTRRLMLTPAGERYLQYCRLIVQTAHDADESMLGLLSEPTGMVTISTPIGLAQSLLPQVLPEFLERYPKVSVRLHITSEVVDLYREQVDIALRARESLDSDANLIARRFGTSDLSLVTSKHYLKKHGEPTRPEDLGKHSIFSFLVTENAPHEWRLYDSEGHESVVSVHPRLISADLQILLEAIKQGQGIGLLPRQLWQRDNPDGSLQTVLPDWRAPQGIVYLVYVSRRGMVPAVRVLIDYLTEQISQLFDNGSAWQPSKMVLPTTGDTRASGSDPDDPTVGD